MTSQLPAWFAHLEDEDRNFIKRFVLASGSLKDLAGTYGVSYPTIRLRLDRLIERIRLLDQAADEDAFHAKVRLLIADGKLPLALGKELLRIHDKTRKEGPQ